MRPNLPHPQRDDFHVEIDIAILELIQLEQEGFYNIPRISWWNLKYQNLHEYCYKYRHTDSCHEDMGCGCSSNSPENTFQGLYSCLDEVLDLYMHEKYFEQELERFEYIKGNDTLINQWLLKNSKLGNEDFILFWIEWYDEDENCVKPFICNWDELGIKFKNTEWISTIKFLELYNELD